MERDRLTLEQQALLSESLTGAELSELLHRLAAEEFHEDRLTTLGDVVEALGTEPITVARVLADIRKGAYEERFRASFETHERRISRVESTVEEVRGAVDNRMHAEMPYLSDNQIEILRDYVHREEVNPNAKKIWLLIALVFIVFVVIGAFIGRPVPYAPTNQPDPPPTSVFDRKTLLQQP